MVRKNFGRYISQFVANTWTVVHDRQPILDQMLLTQWDRRTVNRSAVNNSIRPYFR